MHKSLLLTVFSLLHIFTISLSLAAQDTCATAAELDVSSSCQVQVFNNTDYTASDESPYPTCGSLGTLMDGWFTVTVPDNGSLIVETTQVINGLSDMVIQAYTGSCGNLIPLACDDDGGELGHSLLSFINLTPSTTIYLRVFEYSSDAVGDFGLCSYAIETQAPGNFCSSALALPLADTCMVIAIDHTNATASEHGFNSCISDSYTDSWLSVEVPESGALLIETKTIPGGLTDMIMQIFSGDCDNLLTVDCDDDGGPGFQSQLFISDRTPGEILYIQLSEISGATGIFGICAIAVESSTGDRCADAAYLSPLPTCTPQFFTNLGQTNSNNGTDLICGIEGVGIDNWFSTTIPSSGNLVIETVSISGSSNTDHIMQVYAGTCGELIVIDCNDDGPTGTTSYVELSNRIPGELIYFEVVEFGSNQYGQFGVCSYDPSATDEDGDLWSIIDDCDDTDPTINPDAEDIPDNGIDEDCDGSDLVATHAIANTSLKLFPNPTNGILNFEFEGNFTFELYNISGRALQSGTLSHHLDISSYHNGIYVLIIQDPRSNDRIFEQIILNK